MVASRIASVLKRVEPSASICQMMLKPSPAPTASQTASRLPSSGMMRGRIPDLAIASCTMRRSVRPLFARHHRLARELGEIDASAHRPRMVVGHDQHCPVTPQRHGMDLRVAGDAGEYGEVGAPFEELLTHEARVATDSSMLGWRAMNCANTLAAPAPTIPSAPRGSAPRYWRSAVTCGTDARPSR